MAYTVITGATGGLGRSLAKEAAGSGQNLVLTATHDDALVALQQSLNELYDVDVQVFATDLSTNDGPQKLHNFTQSKHLVVDELINCAGFGAWTRFFDAPWKSIETMSMVNMHALTQLTYLYGNDMRHHHKGRILNISSIASRMPGPFMALYFATKAYVTSLGVALNYELRGSGVSVTTICPGPITTGFEAKAQMKGKNFFTMTRPATADQVAHFAYSRMHKGRALGYQGMFAKSSAFLARLLPMCCMTKIAARMNGGDPAQLSSTHTAQH
ncbi:oxidoreductase, short chain dehydrogenase/reductase family protein [Bifidobacterium dolichotidis]|uniref:Oxidoreductase, short chain dehydrogenase/reductase family protein n=1 Tax=Bifidobacterium dolichotidis TaxID=2306976 RepID=A0A430FSG4_9BIFI|nr:SDR family NAD(P)-dependent oxidoreductase [Bifidobacterium dolichotidis]RSX55832.1 oxidoreductase, short chain dehydrogenase/reductase family protein [Bifidobacterium dolichotidis]